MSNETQQEKNDPSLSRMSVGVAKSQSLRSLSYSAARLLPAHFGRLRFGLRCGAHVRQHAPRAPRLANPQIAALRGTQCIAIESAPALETCPHPGWAAVLLALSPRRGQPRNAVGEVDRLIQQNTPCRLKRS
jgi:hypothetical protein